MIDLNEVRKQVRAIKNVKGSPDIAHQMEDDLYFNLIKAIGQGMCLDHESCCLEATRTKEIEFERIVSKE